MFLLVSTNIASSDPRFLTSQILSGWGGLCIWANSRGWSRWMAGFVEYPLDHNHKAFRADLLGK